MHEAGYQSMIWYFLYFFRGTTEAPDLSPCNPVRIAFTRYGNYIAHHIVTALLISVIVATILIYPIPYLFTDDFTTGASNLPQHVWTAAQPLGKSVSATPDIIMRSFWIHGDYMSALNTHLMVSALELQDELLGSTENFSPYSSREYKFSGAQDWPLKSDQRDSMHIVNGLTNQSWFFHSPLLYWRCSRQQLVADSDLIATVNKKKTQSTSANVTLRHSIVFSGKKFTKKTLIAADALVVTLLYRCDSPVGRQWEHNAPLLAQKAGAKWDIYPQNGSVQESQLYEFQFRPMSPYEIMTFLLAYGLASVHFFASLSKLRAIKSKAGLIVTVIVKVAFTVMSSFTVCAVCNVDLSRIPRAAYPFAVLTTSLENMLRLIHAVILTPSENSTSSRVGSAFGQTAHVSLLSTLQNAAILACLSRIVAPGVGALCIFAAIATIFDFFYLSTFFLSVLSVDVRRIELEEALSKVKTAKHNRSFHVTEVRPWTISNIWRGKIALSTRIAGTVIMILFVIVAQWHFFGHVSILDPARQLFGTSVRLDQQGRESDSRLEKIHQARSPGSWLRLQDHETAQEVIRAIKPSAHSYIAKVYDPLVFVLKNSNRTPPPTKQRLLPAANDFIDHHLAQFLITIIFIGAGLCLLASYLLWVDEEAMDSILHSPNQDGSLSITTLSGGHALDIVMIVASAEGRIVTTGLDRSIRVWDLRSGEASYELPGTKANNDHGLFPILGMALDAESKWLAVMFATQVRVWNLLKHNWSDSIMVEAANHKPEIFCFHPDPGTSAFRLIIVYKDGTMLDLSSSSEQRCSGIAMCTEQLLMACTLIGKADHLSALTLTILSLSTQGKASLTREKDSRWVTKNLLLNQLSDVTLHQVVPLCPHPLFLIGSIRSIYLISAEDGVVQHVFTVEPMVSRSIQCDYSGRRFGRAVQSGVGLANFTIAYIAANTRSCCVINYRPSGETEAIAACAPTAGTCEGWCTWKEAVVSEKHFSRPGTWAIVKGKSIVGVRPVNKDSINKQGGCRQRFEVKRKETDAMAKWQVWTAATDGHPEANRTRDMIEEKSNREELWVIPGLGPTAKVGANLVAFCLGNTIKVVSAGGHGRYNSNDDNPVTIVAHEGRRGRHKGFARSRHYTNL